MATTKNAKGVTSTKRRSPYPPGHQQSEDPYYLDDTLDAFPPYHLFREKPTPEAMEAAKRLAAERGYPPPKFPPEIQGSQDDQDAPAPAASAARSGASSERPKRSASQSRARKK